MVARETWPTVLLCCYLVAVPSESWLRSLGPYDEQRLLQVVLLAAVGIGGLVDGDRRREAVGLLGRWGRAAVLVALVVALGLVSSVRALDPMTGFLEVALVLSLGMLLLHVVVDVRRRPEAVTMLVVSAAAISAAWYAADLLTFPDLRRDAAAGLWRRGGRGGFVVSRFLNQYQVGVIALATPLLFHRAVAPWIRGLLAVVLGATWWMLVVLEGRGAFVALAIAAVAVWGLGAAGRRVAGGLASGAVVGLLGAHLFRRAQGVPGIITGDVTSSSGRLAAWYDATQLALDHLLLGIGPGHLAHVSVAAASETRLAHPHNSLVQVWAEWGSIVAVVGLVAAGGLLWVVVRAARRRSNLGSAPDDLGQVGVIAAMVGLLALSLVSGVLTTPVAQLLLVVSVGVVLGRSVRDDPEDRAVGRRWSVALLVALSLAPALLVTESVVSSAGREWQQAGFVDSGGGVLHPRFWNQGYRGPEPVVEHHEAQHQQ